MSIYNDLHRVETLAYWQETTTEQAMYMALLDFASLGKFLQSTESPDKILYLLRMELIQNNRPSYVSRIYGRYRKLLPKRDMEEIQRWAYNHGKGGEQD